MINPEEIRARFPVLDQEVNGHPLIYLDTLEWNSLFQLIL